MNPPEEKKWLGEYLKLYTEVLSGVDVREKLVQLKGYFLAAHAAGKKVIFIGNGGSAALASHCAVDFTKNAGVRCVNFNEADLITCFSNDFGYEKCFQKGLEFYADPGDVVVLVSSSGKSRNILNAAEYARSQGLLTVTFTGFSSDNPLSSWGQLNFNVPSRAYNVIEMVHHIWILAVCDLIIGKAEYPPS